MRGAGGKHILILILVLYTFTVSAETGRDTPGISEDAKITVDRSDKDGFFFKVRKKCHTYNLEQCEDEANVFDLPVVAYHMLFVDPEDVPSDDSTTIG